MKDEFFTKCSLCPRNCSVDRRQKIGFCGASTVLRVAKATLHYFEEPPISGKKGSGTVFFSGCQMKCVFCQNFEVSRNEIGKEISPKRLSEIYKELEEKGAHNINLVSPTQYVPLIAESMTYYRPKTVVYNSCGYETKETIDGIAPYVDVYLPDFKYAKSEVANRYSKTTDYPTIAVETIRRMLYHQPNNVYVDGLIKKGVIIRHLVLPSQVPNSIAVLDSIVNNFGKDVTISLMSQYTPFGKIDDFPELKRRLLAIEYKRVLAHARSIGLENGFLQDVSSSDTIYIPNFDFSGV